VHKLGLTNAFIEEDAGRLGELVSVMTATGIHLRDTNAT
jgi:hypothetical protein